MSVTDKKNPPRVIVPPRNDRGSAPPPNADRDPFEPPPWDRKQKRASTAAKPKRRSAPKKKSTTPKGEPAVSGLVNAVPPADVNANLSSEPATGGGMQLDTSGTRPRVAPTPVNPTVPPQTAPSDAAGLIPANTGQGPQFNARDIAAGIKPNEQEVQSVRYKYDPAYAGTPPFVEPNVSPAAEAEARRRYSPFGQSGGVRPADIAGQRPRSVTLPSTRFMQQIQSMDTESTGGALGPYTPPMLNEPRTGGALGPYTPPIPGERPDFRTMEFRYGRDDQFGQPPPQGWYRGVPGATDLLSRPEQDGAPQYQLLDTPIPNTNQPGQATPEGADTLTAQFAALRRADAPKSAVLVTQGSQMPTDVDVTGFMTLQVPEGTLYINAPKAGFNTPKEAEQYITNQGYAGLLGYVQPTSATNEGTAVVATDRKGTELGAATVNTPEGVDAQKQRLEDTYPEATVTTTTPAQVAAARRATTPLQQAEQDYYKIANKDYTRTPKLGPDGKPLMVQKKNKDGSLKVDKQGKPVMEKAYEYGADYDKKKDWKDYLRSLGLGFLKGWKETGTPWGGVGSGLTTMFASFFDPNVDNKLQDELIRLPRAMNKYQQVAQMQAAALKMRQTAAEATKAEFGAREAGYKADQEEINRGLARIPGWQQAVKTGVYPPSMVALVEDVLGWKRGTSGIGAGDFREGKEFYTPDGLAWVLRGGELTPLTETVVEEQDGAQVQVTRQILNPLKRVRGVKLGGMTLPVSAEKLVEMLDDREKLNFQTALADAKSANEWQWQVYTLTLNHEIKLLERLDQITKDGWAAQDVANTANAELAGLKEQLAEMEKVISQLQGDGTKVLLPEEEKNLADMRLKKAKLLGDVKTWTEKYASANSNLERFKSEDIYNNIGAVQELLENKKPPPARQAAPRLVTVAPPSKEELKK